MIADIEFRCVKKKIDPRVIAAGAGVGMLNSTLPILQFRKLIATPHPGSEGATSYSHQWTPWQDVPVVEE